MINYEDENEIKLGKSEKTKVMIAVIISLVLTLVFMSFIDFNDMQDTFKINLKTTALSKVVKYYSLTCVFIGLVIFNALNFAIIKIMNFISRKMNKDY